MKKIALWTLALALLAVPFLAAAQTQTPPEGGKPKDFKLPAYRTFTLENGLTATLIPYGRLPLANISVFIRTGAANEAAGQVWLSDLTADYLKEGTATRTAGQIAEQAAGMGGQVSTNSGSDLSSLGGTVLSEYAPPFLKLLADIVRNPSFPQSELARLQAGYLRQLAIAKTQPTALADDAFFRLLYGDHPYGRKLPAEDMIKGYTVPVIRKFYEQNFGARRAHIFVAGVFDDKAVEAALRESLGGWPAGPEVATNVPRPVSQRAIHVADRPGSVQSTIFIGRPVIFPGQRDYIGLLVTDSLLGGAFFSRITRNIREAKGYTYSPYSQVETRFRDACWYEQADVSTEVTGASLKEILFEIERLGKETPSAPEVKGIQNYFAGIFVLQNSSPAGIINQLAFLWLHGLERGFLDGYVQNIYKLTPEELSRIAAEQFPAGDMTVVVVGDLAKIKDQLAPLGKVIPLN